MTSSAAGTSESPVRPAAKKKVTIDKTAAASSEIVIPPAELHAEISGLISSMKRRTHSQRHEMKQRHAEELYNLSKKYHQVKEQLRVQQELMESRENSEKFLQDQLNKATIELAQLRLIKDDLNSSLKQATAQIQYMTREKEKMRAAQEQSDHEKQMGLVQLQEKLMESEQQLEKLKSDMQIAAEKAKAERNELKSQLSGARKAVSELHDENFKIQNEARAMQAQYESEKTEYIKCQQKFSELQMKHAKVSEVAGRMREENEQLKESLSRVKLEMLDLKSELEKANQAKMVLTSQNKSLSDEIKEKNGLLSKSEMDAQRTHAKLDAMVDNFKQSQKMLERVKQNFAVENDGLRQSLMKEKAAVESLKEEHQKVLDDLTQQVRELKLEKSLREKAQLGEAQLRDRLGKTEAVMAELENERVALAQNLQDANEEIELKNELIEENDKKIRHAENEARLLGEQLKDARNKIEQLSSQLGGQSLEELQKTIADLQVANQTATDQLKLQQNQLKDLNLSYEKVSAEKQADLQTIEELNEALKNERDNMRDAVQERKELRKKNKALRAGLMELKNRLSTSESALSLANAENSHLTDLVRDRESKLAELSQENAGLLVRYNRCSDDLRDEKTAHTMLANDNESLRGENSKLVRQFDDMKMREKTLKEKLKAMDFQIAEFKQKAANAEQEADGLRADMEAFRSTYQQAVGQLLEEREQKEKAIIKCNGLTANSQTATASLKSLDTQLTQTKAQLSEKAKALTEVQLQAEQLRDINEHLTQETEALTNEKLRLMKNVQELDKQLKNELHQKEILRAKVFNEIQATLDQLRVEKKALEEGMLATTAKLKDAEEHISELEDVINSLQDDAKLGQRKTNEAENKVYDMQRQMSQLETSMQALQIQNKDQLKMLAQLREDKKELKAQVQSLEQKNVMDRIQQESISSSNLDTLRSKFTSEQNAFIEMDKQQKERIKNLELENGKLHKETRKIKRQAAILVTKYQSLSERTDSLVAQKQELIQENQALRASIVEQSQSYGQLDRQNKKLNKEKTKLLDRIHALYIENEELEEGQSELFNSRARLTQKQSDVLQMELKLAAITDLNRNLRNEVAAAKVANEQSSKDYVEITKTISEIHDLLRPSDDVVCDDGTTAALLSSLLGSKNDIESLLQQRDLLLREVDDFKQATSRLLKAQSDGKNDLVQVLGKHELAEHELQLLRENKEKYDQWEGYSDGIEKMQAALQSSNATLKTLEDENSKLRDEKRKLKLLLEHVRDVHNLDVTIPE